MNCKRCGKKIREPYEAGENIIVRVIGAFGIVEPYCRECIKDATFHPYEFGLICMPDGY